MAAGVRLPPYSSVTCTVPTVGEKETSQGARFFRGKRLSSPQHRPWHVRVASGESVIGSQSQSWLPSGICLFSNHRDPVRAPSVGFAVSRRIDQLASSPFLPLATREFTRNNVTLRVNRVGWSLNPRQGEGPRTLSVDQ